jgi:hypothetical protein
MGSLVFRIAGSGGGSSTCADGSWVTGKVGSYGLSFPGTTNTDQVVVSTHTSIEFGNSDDFSVACWVKSVADSTYSGFVAKNTTDGLGDYEGWLLGQWADNKMFFSPRDGLAAARGFVYTNSAVDGNWHHLVGIRDGTTKLSRLYLDGVLQTDSTTAAMADSGEDLLLGQYWNYSTQYCMNGSIDEVGIWNVVLDSGAISDLYNSGTGNAASNVSSSALVAYYNMEEGAGNGTLTDRTGNGRTGTLTNMDTGSC